MPRAKFEPAFLTSDRPQTCTFDSAASGISDWRNNYRKFSGDV